ncbi:unnamed protein product, partial [Anisakis simplex]|uniref:UDP-glucose:glycoprotein glucosyltransferase (inferred by orthology to a D. melanogaster protein) n=1 Tax=Anisakis simplex TaxID=6269 RepID=A0A0M3KJ40_ANISI
MNPKSKLSELPLKRFYRMVLEPSVQFDDSGRISSAAYQARFASLPSKQLLTLALIPSDSWMVQAVKAVYDLDNIKMQNVEGNVVHTNTESEGVDEVNVLIDSFSGRTIRVRVSKKEGKQDENLLSEGKQTDDDVDEESQSIWSSISSFVFNEHSY